MKKIVSITLAVMISACSPTDGKDAKTQEMSAAKIETQKPASKNDTPIVQIKTTDLDQGVYMLVGRGGNLGVSTGDDGVFVIDDQFANLSELILAEIATLSDGPIRFVANTHYHGDHTGGNAAMRRVGASVVAHDNVRVRMGHDNKFWKQTVKASAPESWPTITFSQNMTFYFNGQTIDVVHVPHAHTDGDSIIYFREANVLHMGDNFFNGLFPFIDIDGGGSVAGMIAALDKGLELSDSATKIIPGHGPLSTWEDMKATRDMLADVRSRVKSRIDAGDDLKDIINANILSDLTYLTLSRSIDEDDMVSITYRSLTGRLD